MTTPADTSAPAPRQTRGSSTAPDERKAFWRAAVLMTSAVVIMVVLFVVFGPSSGPGVTRQEQVNQALTHAPQIIPNPADGRAPTNPGDPGGWEQLMLLGVLVAGLALVGGLAYRSSRRAKRRATAGPS